MMATLILTLLFSISPHDDKGDQLIAAATKGDLGQVKSLIESGVDVNSKSQYGATALSFACDKGHIDIVKYLIEKKADIEVKDTFYNATPITWAAMNGRKDAAVELVKAGAKNRSMAMTFAVQRNDAEFVEALLKTGKFTQEEMDSTLKGLTTSKQKLIEILIKAGADSSLRPKETEKKPETPAKTASASSEPEKPSLSEETRKEVKEPKPWPSFRGRGATGVADGQHPPAIWDATTSKNLLWKTAIPGLGLSCPVIWGDKVFITTAVGEKNPQLRTGQYGDVASVQDASQHEWKVICIDKNSGKILWNKTATSGVPQSKRHTKSSHANCTPATNGEYIVVCFGSEGLYCYSMEGDLKWKKDLGKFSSGWFYDNAYEWGFGSSPVIFRDRVIVQCDIGKGSFIAAYDLKTGEQKWMTPREEIPSWGSASIIEPEHGKPELVTNASKFARSYDPETGEELWRIGKNSEITVPTPFLAKNLIFVTSGYSPIQPIYAIKPGSKGDISLPKDKESSESVVWSKKRGGPYLPSPIAYGDYFYTCRDSGIFSCYEIATGKEIYNKRLPGVNGYTASPVAADGKLYCTSEDGTVRVIAAGPKFELLAVNKLGDDCLCTPAISDGQFIIRGRTHLYAMGYPR